MGRVAAMAVTLLAGGSVLALAGEAPPMAAPPGAAAAPGAWTTAQDHQNMLDQLGITRLRPGRNADANATNAANYDEAKANPYPRLPELLTLANGRKVTRARQWTRERRPKC